MYKLTVDIINYVRHRGAPSDISLFCFGIKWHERHTSNLNLTPHHPCFHPLPTRIKPGCRSCHLIPVLPVELAIIILCVTFNN